GRRLAPGSGAPPLANCVPERRHDVGPVAGPRHLRRDPRPGRGGRTRRGGLPGRLRGRSPGGLLRPGHRGPGRRRGGGHRLRPDRVPQRRARLPGRPGRHRRRRAGGTGRGCGGTGLSPVDAVAGGEPGPAAASGRRRGAVVGGGITGLSAALHLVDLAREHGLDVEVAVLEAGGDFGGKVRTDRPGPFVIEQGPDSLLARKPWGVDLCRRLGVADLLTGPGPHGGRSYLVSRGRLEPMPAGLILGMPASPLALLTTRLVPLSGRLRAALEPWVPRGGGEDESLHQFLCRRLGRSTAEAVAEPLLEAVHAGDARRLSARATYP